MVRHPRAGAQSYGPVLEDPPILADKLLIGIFDLPIPAAASNAYPHSSYTHPQARPLSSTDTWVDRRMTDLPCADAPAAPDPGGTPTSGADGRNVEHTTEQTITIVRGGSDYARVALQGHLDHHSVQRVRTQLGAVLDTGARYLTVDLSDVNLCDENVLDLLCWAERRACAQQGWLTLTAGHHRMQFAIVDQSSPRTKR